MKLSGNASNYITFDILRPYQSPRGGKLFFATILILPNFAIFRGFWYGVGQLHVQLLGNNSRYWHETWPKCLS